jgi:uncharacterized membrane protein
VLLFFLYSLAGWLIEVTLKYIQFHRFINRGFFTGPICPIYGSGALLITLAGIVFPRASDSYGTSFLMSFLLCGTVEYLTSYLMEKRFHARWWDYSQKPMNLHGRVWIGNLVLFGLGGVLIVHLFNPVLYKLFARIPLSVRELLALLLTAIITADFIMSHFVLKLVKTGVERSEADNTEEISREIRLLLRDRSVFHRRFAEAYPEVIYKTERIAARMEAVRAESERLRREAEERVGEVKEQLAYELEPIASVKNGVIRRQEELIDRLYDPSRADEETRALKQEIDRELERLQKRRDRLLKH